MSLVILILLCVAIVLLGAAVGKPLGWIAIGLALLAMILMVLKGVTLV
jgi:uncharacterized membrane protein